MGDTRFVARRTVGGSKLGDANGFVIWTIVLHWSELSGRREQRNDTD